VRFGNDPDSPWEVVGSDDTTFSLDTRLRLGRDLAGVGGWARLDR